MNNYVPDVICMNAIMHSCLPVLSLYCGEHFANFKISSLERLMIIQKQIQIQNLNLVEDGKYSNGVNGSDEGAKEESLKKAEPLLAFEGHSERSGSADPPQCDA